MKNMGIVLMLIFFFSVKIEPVSILYISSESLKSESYSFLEINSTSFKTSNQY